MSERAEMVAEMYRNFAKTPVYEHIKQAIENEADAKRRSARKSEDVHGELGFADGLEWLLDHIKQQQALDKMGGKKPNKST